jgi:tetratricopeptide (TPR) repeat protein
VDDFVVFDDAAGSIGEGVYAAHFKPWTDDEKGLVSQILDHVLKKAPGLLLMASSNGKIAIKRVPILFLPAAHGEARRLGSACNAAGDIVLADKFFRYERPPRILVHELTHAADAGSHISLSKEWVEFAGPTISKIRTQQFDCVNDDDGLLSTIRAKGVWPSGYGCINLAEGLAEYVTAFVEDRDFPIKQQFKQKIAPRLLAPSKVDIAWTRSFRCGDANYRAGHFDEAITEFQESAKIDPSSPLPYVYIAFCYARKADVNKAVEYSSRAVKSFETANVEPADPFRITALRLHGTLLAHVGREQEAIAMLDEVLKHRPRSREALELRADLHEKMGNREGASKDRIALVKLNVEARERERRAAMFRPPGVQELWGELKSFMAGHGSILHGVDVASEGVS